MTDKPRPQVECKLCGEITQKMKVDMLGVHYYCECSSPYWKTMEDVK